MEPRCSGCQAVAGVVIRAVVCRIVQPPAPTTLRVNNRPGNTRSDLHSLPGSNRVHRRLAVEARDQARAKYRARFSALLFAHDRTTNTIWAFRRHVPGTNWRRNSVSHGGTR